VVTTQCNYLNTDEEKEKRREKGERTKRRNKKEKRNVGDINYTNYYDKFSDKLILCNTFLEAKCSRIELQKSENIFEGFPLRVPRLVVPCTHSY